MNDPPGSQPIEVVAGSARAIRTVAVVTFSLFLDTDLSSYDPEATQDTLASLYGVARDAISVEVEAGSLRLVVSIKPVHQSDEALALLIEAINSTSAQNLTAAMGISATLEQIEANVSQEEYEATWSVFEYPHPPRAPALAPNGAVLVLTDHSPAPPLRCHASHPPWQPERSLVFGRQYHCLSGQHVEQRDRSDRPGRLQAVPSKRTEP